MCLVRIPAETKTSKNEPLRRIIEMSSANSGVDQYTVTVVMTHLLEQVAEEVSRGRVVQIPGFGAFFPLMDRYAYQDGQRRCRPRFHPAVGFQQQVKIGAPPQESVTQKFNNYRQNHSAGDRTKRNQSRVFMAMQYFRECISKQLADVRD